MIQKIDWDLEVRFFEDEGLYIESKYNGNLRKVELQDKYGKINVYMLPFVKPVEVKQFFGRRVRK